MVLKEWKNDGYVYGLDGGYGFTGVSYLQIHLVVYSKYV